ncbi:MAG: hypothetical protein R3251_01830 [Candidatus Spechtbacterales bacterium]|nr:hypothetical protein [Candidatus Spechtbacterales bacterium]
MSTAEQLTRFFREEHEKMDLPDDFGVDRQGMTRVYIWELDPSSRKNGEMRIVEMFYYPRDQVAKVLGRVTPANFLERYRENSHTVTVMDISDFEAKKNILLHALYFAGQFAREESLLEVELSEAVPGTYRDTL